ncbi:7541_t:CDS:2, partial [Funneliformis geosporum]
AIVIAGKPPLALGATAPVATSTPILLISAAALLWNSLAVFKPPI